MRSIVTERKKLSAACQQPEITYSMRVFSLRAESRSPQLFDLQAARRSGTLGDGLP